MAFIFQLRYYLKTINQICMNKISLRLFILFFSVSTLTIANKSHKIGKRIITDCFKTVLLTNGWSNYNISNVECNLIPYIENYYPFVQNAARRIDITDTVLDPGDKFFCATVIETTNPSAPIINLGEGLRRYELKDIYCVSDN